MTAMQNNLKSETLLKIAGAIALLTVSVVAYLLSIPPSLQALSLLLPLCSLS
jgi:hypothetical protein